jgi:hypothetical protein
MTSWKQVRSLRGRVSWWAARSKKGGVDGAVAEMDTPRGRRFRGVLGNGGGGVAMEMGCCEKRKGAPREPWGRGRGARTAGPGWACQSAEVSCLRLGWTGGGIMGRGRWMHGLGIWHVLTPPHHTEGRAGPASTLILSLPGPSRSRVTATDGTLVEQGLRPCCPTQAACLLI